MSANKTISRKIQPNNKRLQVKRLNMTQTTKKQDAHIGTPSGSNKFFNQMSCTNAEDVYEPRRITTKSNQQQKTVRNATTIRSATVDRHHHDVPGTLGAKLNPCKCPACTLKRNTNFNNAVKLAPVTAPKSRNGAKPSVKINEIKRNLKSANGGSVKSPRPVGSAQNSKPSFSARSEQNDKKLKSANGKRNISPLTPLSARGSNSTKAQIEKNIKQFSAKSDVGKPVSVKTPSAISTKSLPVKGCINNNANIWSTTEAPKKPNVLKQLFGKLQQNDNVVNNESEKEIKDENPSELATALQQDDNKDLETISISIPADQNCGVYCSKREGSLETRCESFNFVEMPNVDDGNNAPFIALKDKPNNLQIIRSKLGSRNGRQSQGEIEWKKGEMLGRGAFGTVWRGLTITGEFIAVKQAEISSIDMEKAGKEYEKIQQEVELLKSLHHKNIIGYLGTCLEGKVVSIFMQYVPGGSVASVLKQFGALAETVVSRYTKQILDGVTYLHSKNVIHRDLKGSNIMVAPNGCIKLIDFGCARKLMDITKSKAEILKSMKGTPYWMAPEVINETGHGKKSDIWSIGCTVVEMATAKPPWSDMGRYAALFAIANDTANVPKIPDKFTEDAKGFVSLCLKRSSDQRPDVEMLAQHNFILLHWQPDSIRIQNSRSEPINVIRK